MKKQVEMERNSIKKHVLSYKYGFRGIWFAFRFEYNMRYHLAAAILVLFTNYQLQISRTEWLFTLLLIGLAWMAEIFNTSLEKLADRVSPEKDLIIGQAKDLASGAVLIICLFAVVCALIIYLPYFYNNIF